MADRSPTSPHAGDGAVESDWPAEAADAIERAVGAVRDKTTGPALTVARALVYGTLALIVGLAVAVLAAVGLVRALDAYLPQEVWLAHLVVGVLFTAAGALLWARRTTNEEYPTGV